MGKDPVERFLKKELERKGRKYDSDRKGTDYKCWKKYRKSQYRARNTPLCLASFCRTSILWCSAKGNAFLVAVSIEASIKTWVLIEIKFFHQPARKGVP